MRIKAKLKRLIEDERGATAIEYVLIVAFIGLVLIVALGALGTDLSNVFNQVANGF
ncbi:MAG: Flp family type IVb pilin [Rhodospirillales bacterium]